MLFVTRLAIYRQLYAKIKDLRTQLPLDHQVDKENCSQTVLHNIRRSCVFRQ